MFGIPIDRIEFSDVESFCRTGVREGVHLDFKKDFPTRLDKTIAAFANTYGGMALLGVDETPAGALDDSLTFRLRRSSSELRSSTVRTEIAKALLTDIHWSFGIRVDPNTVIRQFNECSFLTAPR